MCVSYFLMAIFSAYVPPGTYVKYEKQLDRWEGRGEINNKSSRVSSDTCVRAEIVSVHVTPTVARTIFLSYFQILSVRGKPRKKPSTSKRDTRKCVSFTPRTYNRVSSTKLACDFSEKSHVCGYKNDIVRCRFRVF